MRPLLIGLIFLFFLAEAFAGSWTNKAGHAASGELIGLDGRKVIIRKKNGTVYSLPLKAFRADEQVRIKTECKIWDVPKGLQASHDFAKRQMTRARLLKEQGLMSEDELLECCKTAGSAFRVSAEPWVDSGKISKQHLDALCAGL